MDVAKVVLEGCWYCRRNKGGELIRPIQPDTRHLYVE